MRSTMGLLVGLLLANDDSNGVLAGPIDDFKKIQPETD